GGGFFRGVRAFLEIGRRTLPPLRMAVRRVQQEQACRDDEKLCSGTQSDHGRPINAGRFQGNPLELILADCCLLRAGLSPSTTDGTRDFRGCNADIFALTWPAGHSRTACVARKVCNVEETGGGRAE